MSNSPAKRSKDVRFRKPSLYPSELRGQSHTSSESTEKEWSVAQTLHNEIQPDPTPPKRWIARRNKPIEVRFWALVDKRGLGECWLWMGHVRSDGYGSLQVGPRTNGRKDVGAHRVSLELKLGRPLAPGECALHKCDVPRCVNPAHLFPGTKADNNADRDAKGRRVDVCLKLTAEKVAEIRKRAVAGEAFLSIAAAFGISDRLAGMIAYGEKWANAPGPILGRARKPRLASVVKELRLASTSTSRALSALTKEHHER